MKNRITNRKRWILASVVAIGVLLCAFAVAFANLTATGPRPADPLPPMTLVYEMYGPSISVGDRSIERFKETIRLEYRGETDWKETVIESLVVDLGRYGTSTNQGTFRQLKGNGYTEYDAMTGETESSTEDGSGVLLPNAAFSYSRGPRTNPFGPDIAGVASQTTARLCFNGECENNAQGVAYTKGGMTAVVLEAGGFVLPMKIGGDFFVLKSAEIEADRP